ALAQHAAGAALANRYSQPLRPAEPEYNFGQILRPCAVREPAGLVPERLHSSREFHLGDIRWHTTRGEAKVDTGRAREIRERHPVDPSRDLAQTLGEQRLGDSRRA